MEKVFSFPGKFWFSIDNLQQQETGYIFSSSFFNKRAAY